MSVPAAFYEPIAGDTVRATEHTTGPWDARAQHAGAPSALLGGAMQRAVSVPLVRVTMEILRPVPITTLTVATEVVRPGRKVTMVEGSLSGGAFNVHGPAAVWGRPRVDLVAGRAWHPLERVLVLADAGNGVSSSADVGRWMFINTELSVHLTRPPDGDWVGLDAHSVYEPHGVGAAFSVVHDVRGPIGRAAQSLFLGPQPER